MRGGTKGGERKKGGKKRKEREDTQSKSSLSTRFSPVAGYYLA